LYTYCANNPLIHIDPSGNIYLIAWSYGTKDVKEYEQYNEQYLANNLDIDITIDGKTDDWNEEIWDDFNQRSSFARAAYTRKKELLERGIPESDIEVQRIDSREDLKEVWEKWAEYDLVEGLDFYSHGYSGGPEVYRGSGNFWDSAQKLNWGSTLRNLIVNGKQIGYVNSPYAAFYGCNTANGEFAQNFADKQGVATFAQTDFSNFSRTTTYRSLIDTHDTSLDVYLLSFETMGLINKDGRGKIFIPQPK